MSTTNNTSHLHLVIMAGGIGSRFWPMSTPERPKQFVDVLGTGRTFIQMTVDRFQGIIPAENVWVVTSQAYKDIVAEQLPEIPAQNILLEPCRRNTAPCIAYAAWRIKSMDAKANIVVSPSDHLVLNVQEFQRVIKSCLDFASSSDAIITLGMKPTRPETGYGYIQTDMSCPSVSNKEMFRVDAFREKPDLATAEKYITKPNSLQKKIAQQLCDMGVDVIVGGHPHVIQPIEMLTSGVDPSHATVCLYSMGNAVSNIRKSTTKPHEVEDGMLFDFTLAKYSDGSVIVESINVLPTWVDRRENPDSFPIIPLDTTLEDWQTAFGLTEDTLPLAQASLARTEKIIREGLDAANSFYSQRQAEHEAAIGVTK